MGNLEENCEGNPGAAENSRTDPTDSILESFFVGKDSVASGDWRR